MIAQLEQTIVKGIGHKPRKLWAALGFAVDCGHRDTFRFRLVNSRGGRGSGIWRVISYTKSCDPEDRGRIRNVVACHVDIPQDLENVCAEVFCGDQRVWVETI